MNYNDSARSSLFGTASFMYRRQPLKGGFTWRIGFTPIIANGYIMPSGAARVRAAVFTPRTQTDCSRPYGRLFYFREAPFPGKRLANNMIGIIFLTESRHPPPSGMVLLCFGF